MGAHSVSVEALVNLLVGSDAVGPYLKELSGGVSIPINLGGGAGKGNTLGKQLKGFNEYVLSSAASIDGISKRVKEIVGNKGFQLFAKLNERAAQSYRKLNEEFGKAAESISPKESMQFTTELANRRGQIILEAFSEIGITAEQISEAYIKSASSPAEAVKMAAKIFNAGENGFISGESGPLMLTLNVAANKLFDKLNGSGSERYYKDGEFTATGVKEVENFRRVLLSASQALNGNFEAANRSLRQYNENADALNKTTKNETRLKLQSTRQLIKDAESLDKAVQGVTKSEKTVESAARGVERVSETAKVEAAATTEAAKATSQATETIIASNETSKKQNKSTINTNNTGQLTNDSKMQDYNLAVQSGEILPFLDSITIPGMPNQTKPKTESRAHLLEEPPVETIESTEETVTKKRSRGRSRGRNRKKNTYDEWLRLQQEWTEGMTEELLVLELMRDAFLTSKEFAWKNANRKTLGYDPVVPNDLYQLWFEESLLLYPDKTSLRNSNNSILSLSETKKLDLLETEAQIGEELIEQNNTMIAQEKAKEREVKKTNEQILRTSEPGFEEFEGFTEIDESVPSELFETNNTFVPSDLPWIYENTFFKGPKSLNPLKSFVEAALGEYGGTGSDKIKLYIDERATKINGELAKLPERTLSTYTGTAENLRYLRAVDAEKYFSERIQQVDTAIDNSVENYRKRQGVTEDAVLAMTHTNEQVFESVMGMNRKATNVAKQQLRLERIQAGKLKIFREGLDTNIKEFLTPSIAKEITSGKLDMVLLQGITPEAVAEWGNMAQVFRTAATGFIGSEKATPEQLAQAREMRNQITQLAMQLTFKPKSLLGMIDSAMTQSDLMLESARNLSKYRAELDATESRIGETTSAYELATAERLARILQLEKGLAGAKSRVSEAAQTKVITEKVDSEGKTIRTEEMTDKEKVARQESLRYQERIDTLKTEQTMADEMYKNTLTGLENQGKKQAKQWSDALAATVALGVNPNTVRGGIAALGLGIKSFGKSMTNISNLAMMEMMGAQMVFEQFKGIVSGMYSYVEAFDSQMREYKKILPKWNEKDMRSYVRGLSDMGQTYGKTVEEMAEASIVMTRGGYGGADATSKQINRGMTEAALLMSNIADEELSVSDASDQLISVTKAYGVLNTDAAAFSTSIADKVNEVSNNFSITSNALMEALPIVSSSAAVSGINENELIGLITGGAEIKQSMTSL